MQLTAMPQPEPYIAGVAVVAVFALLGVYPVRKFFEVMEARNEMLDQSPSFLRRMRGWSMIAVWTVLTAFAGSFIGDWSKSGDPQGAAERAWVRAEYVLYILTVIMESDQ